MVDLNKLMERIVVIVDPEDMSSVNDLVISVRRYWDNTDVGEVDIVNNHIRIGDKISRYNKLIGVVKLNHTDIVWYVWSADMQPLFIESNYVEELLIVTTDLESESAIFVTQFKEKLS